MEKHKREHGERVAQALMSGDPACVNRQLEESLSVLSEDALSSVLGRVLVRQPKNPSQYKIGFNPLSPIATTKRKAGAL